MHWKRTATMAMLERVESTQVVVKTGERAPGSHRRSKAARGRVNLPLPHTRAGRLRKGERAPVLRRSKAASGCAGDKAESRGSH